jgi:peptidyl-prolyl cis-trans isomerase B (cyclophilin B)
MSAPKTRFTAALVAAVALLALLSWSASTFSMTNEDAPMTTENRPQVRLHTSAGAITIELYADKAPESVANFLQYVQDGHYDNTLFHRVIANFMIQGGGFDADFNQKPTREPIRNEADNGVSNTRGTVAMARTNQPHSATAQFFINVTDNGFLDHTSPNSPRTWGYAVFGEVIDGMDVVEAIRTVATHSMAGHQDVPVEAVLIERAEKL